MNAKELREVMREANEHAGSYRYLQDLCQRLVNQGHLKEALAMLKRMWMLIRLEPGLADIKSMIWSTIAGVLFRLDRGKDSLRAAETARDLDRMNDEAWEYIALGLWSKNKLPEAYAAYQQALDCCPADHKTQLANLMRSCAKLCQVLNKPDLAAEYEHRAEGIAAELRHPQATALPATS